MRAPLDGTLLLTQLFGSLRGGAGERYTAWRNGQLITCNGHPAIDFNCAVGSRVYAAKAGVIEAIFNDQFFGNFVVLTLPDGEKYTYAHLSFIETHTGQQVQQGELIALSGATGNVTGPHLHMAFRPPHPNYANGFDGYEDFLTHFDASAYAALDLSLV